MKRFSDKQKAYYFLRKAKVYFKKAKYKSRSGKNRKKGWSKW